MNLWSNLSVPPRCWEGKRLQALAAASDAVGTDEEEAPLVDTHELWLGALPADTKH